jgi:hypothetical protein
MFSELNLVQGSAASRYLSPSLPLCLRFNQPLQLMVLIGWLQNSILSLRLTVTQAGFTPARLQDLASPHTHVMVLSVT